MAKHKHHDLIIAWAKGAEIEIQSLSSGAWYPDRKPVWDIEYNYRIKPREFKYKKGDYVLLRSGLVALVVCVDRDICSLPYCVKDSDGTEEWYGERYILQKLELTSDSKAIIDKLVG